MVITIRTVFSILLMLLVTKTAFSANGSMSMGMNTGSVNYYNPTLVFTDVMKASSKMLTFTIGTREWNSGVLASIPVDSNGWPLELPYNTNGKATGVRILLNNRYKGEYIVTWDGDGEITWNVPHKRINGVHYITLSGFGNNVWISLTKSTPGNHIRNIRIFPQEYEATGVYPIFNGDFLSGLKPFETSRFMDWMETNDSKEEHWSKRKLKDYYTQAGGISIDYAIELANQLQSNVWFNIPHKASDDYITNFAKLVKQKLDTNLNVYIEFSNELWNWQFTQSKYVLNNAPGHADSYVSEGLSALGAAGKNHPEKDAYMMARTFKIWEEVWADERNRLIAVAAVQAAWAGNTDRILDYLFNVDGVSADALAATAYLNFTTEDHERWNSMDPSDVTAQMVIDAASRNYDKSTAVNADKQVVLARQYNIDYIIYEGGQHMQPHKQQDWGYNHAVWDAQIHPKMYDLYVKNLQKHLDIDTTLFVAFSYVSERKSKYGSWGHLEKLGQLKSNDLKSIAPKYQALVDFAKETIALPSVNPPSAGFTVSTNNLTADFSDASSDSDGTLESWLWDFGDGDNSTLQNPRHTYKSAASYTVILTVTDNEGATNSISKQVTLLEPPQSSVIIDNRISSRNNDVEETLSNGSVVFNSSDIELGNDDRGYGKQRVGLRFQGLNIPQGATIVSAYLEFVVDETNSSAANIVINAESADNALAFTTKNNDVRNRPLTSTAIAWDIPAWNTIGKVKQSPDISSILQKIVDRSGWRANNSMVFVIQGSGKRTAESYEGKSSAAPLLHVEYSTVTPNSLPTAGFVSNTTGLNALFSDTSSDNDGMINLWSWNFGDGAQSTLQNPSHTYTAAGSYTVTLTVTNDAGATDSNSQQITLTEPPKISTTIEYRIDSGYNDVEETRSNGRVIFNSSDMELGNDIKGYGKQTVGLRFQNINIPQGATINSAYLEFTVDETNNSTTSIMIGTEAADDALAFSADNGDVTKRPLTATTVVWDIPAWNTISEVKQSPDISSSLQEVVNRSGWRANNSMVFVIQGSGKRTAEAYEGHPSSAPLLHVKYMTDAQ